MEMATSSTGTTEDTGKGLIILCVMLAVLPAAHLVSVNPSYSLSSAMLMMSLSSCAHFGQYTEWGR